MISAENGSETGRTVPSGTPKEALGDYFGNTSATTATGSLDYSSFVSTYDDGTNPAHYQQQIVATVAVP